MTKDERIRYEQKKELTELLKKVEQIQAMGGVPGEKLSSQIAMLKTATEGLPNLEEKFKQELSKFDLEIEEYLSQATHALRRAVETSQKYGFPFRTDICFAENTYYPHSFQEKWGVLDAQFLRDMDRDYLTFTRTRGQGWMYSDTRC